MAGPFEVLDAEAIEQELGDMSRALYKRSKLFTLSVHLCDRSV